MIRYFYLGVAALLLLMSFTQPRSQQASLSWGRLFLPDSMYEFLFLFCIVIFIPMMGVAFYYFFKGFTVFLAQRSLRSGLPVLLVAVAVTISLYSFNAWVFREIF